MQRKHYALAAAVVGSLLLQYAAHGGALPLPYAGDNPCSDGCPSGQRFGAGGLFLHRAYPYVAYPAAMPPPVDLRRGIVEVHVPDERGLLYVNGNPTPLRGPIQVLRTEVLAPGAPQTLTLRAAFRSGDDLLIEDQNVAVGAGEVRSFTFEGHRGVRVPLRAPPESEEELPLPRRMPPTR